jgi:DNA (cytosine-5)-methyltransferase 1
MVAVDLFCGVGGLTCGLEEAGIETSVGIDVDPHCRYPYKTNTDTDFVEEDVSKLSSDRVADFFGDTNSRILAGCAPCQPFSNLNNGENTAEWDDWALLDEFRRLVWDLEPEVVTMENVTEVRNHQVYSRFVDALFKLGYDISSELVYCPDYGVPQKRRRLVLLASKFGPIELNEPTPDPDDHPTVRDTIGNGTVERLESDEESDTDRLHKGRKLEEINLERIRQSVPGGTWRDWDEDLRLDCHKKESGSSYDSVYGRMKWDEPAPTITTQFYNYGSGRFGHPEQDRALTLREGAMLQTFPEDYTFVDPDDEVHLKRIGRLVGNAVPVELAKSIGNTITQHLERNDVTPTTAR